MSTGEAAQIRRCDECGRLMDKAGRIEKGHTYCRTCYSREFKPAECTLCGKLARVLKGDANPKCSLCKRKDRRCPRCNRPVLKAAKIVNGHAVCAVCVIYFTEPTPCAECGKLSKRVSRALTKGFNQPVCDRCRNSDHRTCCICRRYRNVLHFNEQQKPVCARCADSSDIHRLCQTCGSTLLGHSTCRICELAERAKKRMRLNIELIEQPWVRSLFEAFFAWDGLNIADNITKRIDRYGVFFAEIDRSCSSLEELNQSRLFEIFGGEGLRRGYLVIKFFCEQKALHWDHERLEEMIENRRISQLTGHHHSAAWFPILQAYIAQLMEREPPLKSNTVRMYQKAAANFLSTINVISPEDITQKDMDSYLKRRRGQIASLSSFAQFLSTFHGIELKLHHKAPMPINKKDRELVRRTQTIFHRLMQIDDPRCAQALLAKLIADLYQIPLKYVLTLLVEEVRIEVNGLVLWPDSIDVRLDGAFLEHFNRWVSLSNSNKFVFSGRNCAQPLSCGAVGHYLKLIDQ
ncbi:hypothetical protein JAMGFMIE_03876 [Rheinheimera sp. MM224]|nr:hypothetical protein JAMGFMIE_03876 [Rheinheimera sp. MM224]